MVKNAETKTEEVKKKNTLQKILPFLTGGAGAALAYKLFRQGRLSSTPELKKIQQLARKKGFFRIREGSPKNLNTAKGKIKNLLDKFLYGADEVAYAPLSGKKIITRQGSMKPSEGVVMHAQDWTPDLLKGKYNIGVANTKKLQKLLDNKAEEAKLIKKLFKGKSYKEIFPETLFYKGKIDNEKLKKILSKNKKFFIKPNEGFASGVGGKNFINEENIKLFLEGKLNNPRKKQVLLDFINNPKKYILQKKLDLKYDPLTGAESQFRIHAFGDKILKGGENIRAHNVSDILKRKKAAAWFEQNFLKKLPKDYKSQNVSWAADIVSTPKGYKILELNPVTAASGFLDPKVFTKEFPNFYNKKKSLLKNIKQLPENLRDAVSSSASAATSALGNQKLYRHFTGRDTIPYSAIKGLVAGGAVGGGTLIAQNSMAKKKEDNKNV